MARYEVYLNDDNDVVPKDQATQIVRSETDANGSVIEEEWIKLIQPSSAEAEHLERTKQAQEQVDRDTTWSHWVIIAAFIGFIMITLWLIR